MLWLNHLPLMSGSKDAKTWVAAPTSAGTTLKSLHPAMLPISLSSWSMMAISYASNTRRERSDARTQFLEVLLRIQMVREASCHDDSGMQAVRL